MMSSLHIGGSTYFNEILHSHYLATEGPRREIQQGVAAVTWQQCFYVMFENREAEKMITIHFLSTFKRYISTGYVTNTDLNL